MKPRIGSLCSGYGGLDLGLMDALGEGEVAWHAEIDDHPAAVLAARWPGVPNLGDITSIDWTGVEPVDWLTAGYPCQPFSPAGKRLGSKDERHLWPDVARAVGVLRPRRLLLENVSGHVSLGLDTVLADLAAMGYDALWGVVRASNAGAPHERARVFLLGSDADAAASGWGRAEGQQRGMGPARLHAVPAPDADSLGRERTRSTRGRRGGPQDGDQPSTNSDQPKPARKRTQQPGRATTAGRRRRVAPDPERCGRAGWTPDAQRDAIERAVAAGCRPSAVQWGAYEPAIRRWEHVTGRSAPHPTEPGRGGKGRLSRWFDEWLMGLPFGWVTDVLDRSPSIKALGNGVVPQQAALAVSVLIHKEAEVAA